MWTWRAAWACGALRTRIGCEGVEVGAGVSSAVAVLVIVVGAVVAVTALLLLLPLLLDLPVGDMAVVGGQQCEECVRCCEMYRSSRSMIGRRSLACLQALKLFQG